MSLATTEQEIPVFVPGRSGSLFGILTRPVSSANGVTVVFLTGGAYIPSTNRNRLWVRLARELAGLGFHTFRFDYHGVGESTGELEGYRLDKPFVSDLDDVLGWLRDRGLTRFVLVGACFGARTALAAVGRSEGVEGVVLCAPPVHDFEMGRELAVGDYVRQVSSRSVLKGLLDRKKRYTYRRIVKTKLRVLWVRSMQRLRGAKPGAGVWVSPHVTSGIERATKAGIPVLIVYGRSEDFALEWDKALTGSFGKTVSAAGSLIEVVRIAGTVHGFARLDVQDDISSHTQDWLRRVVLVSERTSA